jgi:hypothetical protein
MIEQQGERNDLVSLKMNWDRRQFVADKSAGLEEVYQYPKVKTNSTSRAQARSEVDEVDE